VDQLESRSVRNRSQTTDTAEAISDAPAASDLQMFPLTFSVDANDQDLLDAEEKSRMYDYNLPLVKRYYHKTIVEIENQRAAAISKEDYRFLVKEKRDIWRNVSELSDIEKQLNLSSLVRLRLLAWSAGAIAAAICLAFPSPEINLSGAALLCIPSMVKLIWWIVRRVHKVGKMCQSWFDSFTTGRGNFYQNRAFSR
jgi:hypothetical protein